MTPAPILTAGQMRAAEQAVFASGLSEYDLMERAGAAAADIIWRAGGRRDALILCGPGNNGGDGFVIARLLRARGLPVRVAATGESRTPSSQRARSLWHGPVEPLTGAAPASQLVDALFGTGLSRGLDNAISDPLCTLAGKAGISFAIDLPSGVDSDSGAILSPVPRFDVCIALGALKPAHLLYPAAGQAARIVCADIGIRARGDCHRLAAPAIAAPGPDAHKYNRGLVAVVAGVMPGASLLAARAAAHAGCGMVRRITPDGEASRLDAIVNLCGAEAADIATALADQRLSAVIVGPGLGREDDARSRLHAAIGAGHRLVLDADALALIAPEAIPPGAILTPHEGEFVRLFGDLPGSKIDRARAAAARTDAIVIYKGADSVIASPDGRVAVASGASSWLSTAGTGDVLAGIAAGRLAVTGDPFRAASEAVWLHGEAARRAGAAFVADDLITHLPAALASRL
ncbi:NAD(P)H-hydrate dehydratase [Sphingobium sp. AN558]|uniref:NAD(P)H-hydrate dehydratase n=1 Tax=Sphingobium sp. AN558 TaxID=3133442 RepID=UPI0030C30178